MIKSTASFLVNHKSPVAFVDDNVIANFGSRTVHLELEHFAVDLISCNPTFSMVLGERILYIWVWPLRVTEKLELPDQAGLAA